MIGSSCISSTIFYYTPSPKSASYSEAFVLKYMTKLYYTVYCFDKLLNNSTFDREGCVVSSCSSLVAISKSGCCCITNR